MKLDYGKYRGIIVSIALFLLLDASVLLMNFYISFQIAHDAVSINLAGRQRMLSQRTMKSLLELQRSEAGLNEQQKALEELGASAELFHTTLLAFDTGGEAPSTDGSIATLDPVSSAAALDAVAEGKVLWFPLYDQIKSLPLESTINSPAFQQKLAAAIQYGHEHNLTLLMLMNQLTTDLEAVASSQATRLRIIQTVGICLALINFFIIMFHFLRQLRESDEKIETARQETQEILDTVNEGLFLIDTQQKIGVQHSKELEHILSRENIAGKAFAELMADLISEKDLSTTKSFIKLLFDPRKKQKLIGDLNPLRKVELHIPQENGGYENKHLSFTFTRVMKGKQIIHILVTVTDISEQVRLAAELEQAQARGQEQLQLLSSIVQTDPDMLTMFLNSSHKTFNEINEILKVQSKSTHQYVSKINQIYALIHKYKGEAAALEFEQFVELAHEFEDKIAELKTNPNLSGNDFLKLTIKLDQLMEQTETIQHLAEKVSGLNITERSAEPNATRAYWDGEHFHSLAQQVAERQGKQVEVICAGFNDHALSPNLKETLNTVAIQLIRNAVSHGVETPTQRQQEMKASQAEIYISLVKRANGTFQLTIEDDGMGINLNKIRTTAVEQGVISAEEATDLNNTKTAALIFHPELSTKTEADTDAGRGIGLYAIRDMIRNMGGKISVSSRRGIGSIFTVTLPEYEQSLKARA